MARADGSLRSLLARLSRIDVLVIDDWVMAPLSEPERRDCWEICGDRYQVRSTILTSQLPVSRWHERSATPPWPTAFSTSSFITPIALRCEAIRCTRVGGSRTRGDSASTPPALVAPLNRRTGCCVTIRAAERGPDYLNLTQADSHLEAPRKVQARNQK